MGSRRALRSTASTRCQKVHTCTTNSASIPIGWVRGVSPSPSPDPFKLIPETWCSYGGQEHQTWGLALECYGVYPFPRTVTGVERGRDVQGVPWSSPSGHGELSWQPWFAQPGQYRSTLVTSFFLFLCYVSRKSHLSTGADP